MFFSTFSYKVFVLLSLTKSEQLEQGWDEGGDGGPHQRERVQGSEDPLPEDVEDAGEEEEGGEEDQHAVSHLSPAVLRNQTPENWWKKLLN